MTELEKLQQLSEKLSTIGVDLLDFLDLDIAVGEALSLDNAALMRLINAKRGVCSAFAKKVEATNLENNAR